MRATLLRNTVPACIGTLAGALIMLSLLLFAGGYQWYKDNYGTVVAMRADLVFYDHDSALLHIHGDKLHNCEYKGLFAFVIKGPRATKHDASFRRLDRPVDNHTKPVGHIDAGFWLLENLENHRRVEIHVNHKCGEVYRTTLIADLEIPNVSF